MTDSEIRLLADRHRSQVSMAKELGCSREWARRLCDRAGVDRFRKGGKKVMASRVMVQKMWLRGLSAPEISSLLEMPLRTVESIVQYWRSKGMRFDRRHRRKEGGDQ